MTLVTRAGKGSPLTWAEVDGNFTQLYAAHGTTGATAISAATYAVARTLTGTTTGDTLYVLGRTAQSDGGQGLFTWVAGGTTTVDEGYALSATGGGIWRRADLTSISSLWFGMVADGYGAATDNGAAINKWIGAANELITAGAQVKMVLSPTSAGWAYATTLRHVFNGNADVVFEGGTRLLGTGTDETNPLMTHGSVSTLTFGRLQGIAVDSAISANRYNPEFVGVRLLNKTVTTHEILFVRGFYRGVQFQGNTQYCGYNITYIGLLQDNKENVNFNSRDSGGGFVSQNTLIGGSCQTSTALNTYGSMYVWTFTEDWETAHAGQTGNFWYSPGCEIGPPANTWAPTSAAFAAGQRIYTPKMGGEWLVKTAGTTGSTEPSLLPAVVDKTNITVTAGSAIITMASTTGIVAGQQLRGTNPAFAFPVNTYVASNDSGTQVTLTVAAAAGSSSTTYHGSFIATTTDGSVTLVYLGPYRRSAAWMRNCGHANGMINARWESGAGEALIISGTHLYPEALTETLGAFTGTFQSGPGTAVNICNAPQWQSNHAYVVGDMVRPAVLGTVFWECLAAGTSTNGAEPTPANSTAGSTFVDTGVTWIIRPIRNSASNGDWGEYTGGNGGQSNTWTVSISNTSNEPSSSAGVENIHYRACGSAAGWRVKGLINSNAFANMSTDFAATDFVLCRDGLYQPNSGVYAGIIFDTSYNKCFIIKRNFGAYATGRAALIPLDANASHSGFALFSPAAQPAYHRRIQSIKTLTGAHTYLDVDDNETFDQYILVNDEVKYVFFGGGMGTNAPTLSGIAVTVAQHRARASPIDKQVQIFSSQGEGYNGRTSLGIPTKGFYLCKGEFIHNASAVAGGTTPRGWVVTTAGCLAPAWVTSTAYIKGQMVTAGANVYASNGKFTSGTTPSGTGFNFLDTTATSITSGDVATWDFVAVVAVLAADSNIP